MSMDHKPENDKELTRIKNAGGRVTGEGRVNGGLNLSRAIGKGRGHLSALVHIFFLLKIKFGQILDEVVIKCSSLRIITSFINRSGLRK